MLWMQQWHLLVPASIGSGDTRPPHQQDWGCWKLSWETHGQKNQFHPISFHLSLSQLRKCCSEPLAVKVLLAGGDYFLELGWGEMMDVTSSFSEN